MKIRTLVYIMIIAALVGGFVHLGRNEKLKSAVTSFHVERNAYRVHHRPQDGWYYSIESVSVEPVSKKMFIIGRNMQPMLSTSRDGTSVTLEPNGKLHEVEVPAKTAGLKSVAGFFTVKTVDGQPTLIYFPGEQEVIKHMIGTRDTPGT